MNLTETRIAKIFGLLREKPMTCEELEHELGLPHQTVSSCCTRLRSRGFIWNSGKTRLTRAGVPAILWNTSAGYLEAHPELDSNIRGPLVRKRSTADSVEFEVQLFYRGHTIDFWPVPVSLTTALDVDESEVNWMAQIKMPNGRISRNVRYNTTDIDDAILMAINDIVGNSTGNQKPWFPLLCVGIKALGKQLPQPGSATRHYYVGLDIQDFNFNDGLETVTGLNWANVTFNDLYPLDSGLNLTSVALADVRNDVDSRPTCIELGFLMHPDTVDEIIDELVTEAWDEIRASRRLTKSFPGNPYAG